ncbi:MAG: DUF4440 domain-containing protein [Cytophagales bacterium]|nr:DUF4440 domain-containing protein [Bernardetiaceae bacterium]MDW8210745.1 DUF4440 domain-containing protein [Cytophagales bacterium]
MNRPVCWLIAFCGWIFFNARAQTKDEASIRVALQAQAQAWNNADLESFMSWYEPSEHLLFVSKSGLQKGWQKLYERYRKNYPGKEGMGRLHFEIIENRKITRKVFYTVGKWEVKRTGSDGQEEVLQGYFTLLWRKKKGKWFIVADHTS